MTGELGILNVGAGDIKLSFDKANPMERARASRIVKDMLNRGYALFVEVGRDERGPVYERALDFSEDTCEYILADLDPTVAEKADNEEASAKAPGAAAPPPAAGTPARRGRRPGKLKTVAAEKTSGVAVARSAGG